MQKNRIFWIDALRGLAILAMLLYHAVFDVLYMVGIPAPNLAAFLESDAFSVLHAVFVAVFLVLAGICSHLTRHPFLRAGKVFLAALLITVVTGLTAPDEMIVFGILHCMAVCMLLEAVLHRALCRIPVKVGIFVSALAALLVWHVPDGYIGFGQLTAKLPASWYRDAFLAVGLPGKTFASLDYVPLIPYAFLFFCGSFIGRFRLPNGKHRFRVLEYMGRHSLPIYLIHQPVLLGICMLAEKWRGV